MPSEHYVLQVLLSQYPRDRFFADWREFLLGKVLALLDHSKSYPNDPL